MSLSQHIAWTKVAFLSALLSGACAVGSAFALDLLTPEPVANGLNSDNLVRFQDKVYSVTYDDTVSTKPISTARVRKIEYGKSSFVDVTTTSTGTYSSEALFSPHFRYAGVDVKELGAADTGGSGLGSSVDFWTRGSFGWLRMPINLQSSLVTVRGPDHRMIVNGGTVCVLTRTFSGCN